MILPSSWCRPHSGNAQPATAASAAAQAAAGAVVPACTGPAVCTPQPVQLLLTCESVALCPSRSMYRLLSITVHVYCTLVVLESTHVYGEFDGVINMHQYSTANALFASCVRISVYVHRECVQVHTCTTVWSPTVTFCISFILPMKRYCSYNVPII